MTFGVVYKFRNAFTSPSRLLITAIKRKLISFVFCVSLITFIFHGKLINNFKCARNFFHSDLLQCFCIYLSFKRSHLETRDFKSESCLSQEFTYSIFISKQKLVIRECFHNFMFEMKDSIKNEIWMRARGRWTECTRLGNKFIRFWKWNTWRSGKMFAGGNLLHGMAFQMKKFYK